MIISNKKIKYKINTIIISMFKMIVRLAMNFYNLKLIKINAIILIIKNMMMTLPFYRVNLLMVNNRLMMIVFYHVKLNLSIIRLDKIIVKIKNFNKIKIKNLINNIN